MAEPIEVVKALFAAYVEKDRVGAERVVSHDFRFTSPLDNGLDREAYFRICWPNSGGMTDVDLKHLVDDGGRVFATYEIGTTSGKRFRNTEVLEVRDGRIVSVEVYFGWNLPHGAPEGEHRDPQSR